MYLLRHASTSPDPEAPNPAWRLNDIGRRQAEGIVTALSGLGITSIYSSPYPRAVDTVQPFSAHSDLQIQVIDDLRECYSLPHFVDDPEPVLKAYWAGQAAAGAESANACTERIKACLEGLRNTQGVPLVCSHGQAIALYLHSLDNSVDFDFWQALPMPALFEISQRGFREIDI